DHRAVRGQGHLGAAGRVHDRQSAAGGVGRRVLRRRLTGRNRTGRGVAGRGGVRGRSRADRRRSGQKENVDRLASMTGAASSKWSIRSQDSFLCIGCKGSVLSIGSVGSVLSIGSVGSAGSLLSIGSVLSAVSVMSGL